MQSLGTGSVGDNLLGSFWIVCGEVTIIVPASLLSPCPRCAETCHIVAKHGACAILLLAGQIKPSCPRVWTCVDTGQYFAVLESHSVIKHGLEHLKDTACLHGLSQGVEKRILCQHTVCRSSVRKTKTYTPVYDTQ